MSQTEKTIQNYRTLREQQGWADAIRYLSEKYETPPLAHVHSFGCQQSVYDGERFKGVLAQLGYGFTDEIRQADLILYNTCAVRENAEQRVFGNVGALKGLKKQKPDMVTAGAFVPCPYRRAAQHSPGCRGGRHRYHPVRGDAGAARKPVQGLCAGDVRLR